MSARKVLSEVGEILLHVVGDSTQKPFCGGAIAQNPFGCLTVRPRVAMLLESLLQAVQHRLMRVHFGLEDFGVSAIKARREREVRVLESNVRDYTDLDEHLTDETLESPG